MSRLRVAQLSFWFVHAQQFCIEAQISPEVELVAAWDSDKDRGATYAHRYGAQFHESLEDLLARDDIDAVSLCAEAFRQPSLAEAAAKAGKHLLIEKPLASDLAGAERIVQAVESGQVQAMPAYSQRFNPVSLKVKELIDSGAIGEIARVRRLHGHFKQFEDGNFQAESIADRAGWGDPAQERRDSLFYSGSHIALWFQWMFGSPTSAQCMRTTAVTAGLDIEDNSIAVFQYDQGFIGSMELSETLLAQPTVTEIYGTEGVIVQLRGNLPSSRVWNTSMTPLLIFDRQANEWWAPRLPPHFLRHEEEFHNPGQFFRALLEEREVPTNIYDGYDSIAMLAAAEQSAAEKRQVPVTKWPRRRTPR